MKERVRVVLGRIGGIYPTYAAYAIDSDRNEESGIETAFDCGAESVVILTAEVEWPDPAPPVIEAEVERVK